MKFVRKQCKFENASREKRKHVFFLNKKWMCHKIKQNIKMGRRTYEYIFFFHETMF